MIKILLVDDNKTYCDTVQEYINRQEDMMVVGVAPDGRKGVELYREHNPDVVLLDIIMPRMDGLGFLDEIAPKENEGARIVVLSAAGHERLIRSAITKGAHYYLIKPFDLKQMVARIRDLCSQEPEAYSLTAATAEARFPQYDKRVVPEERITYYLNQIGVPAKIAGFSYLRCAIKAVYFDMNMMYGITKKLYPYVAERFNSTPSRVERSMRHAIEVAWNRGRMNVIDEIFGYTIHDQKGKPTNGEFISMIADRLRVEDEGGASSFTPQHLVQ